MLKLVHLYLLGGLTFPFYTSLAQDCKPAVSINGASTICEGESTVLQTRSHPGVTLRWLHNGQPIEKSTDTLLHVKQAGEYRVEATRREEKWEWSLSGAQGNSLNDVQFVGNNYGWIVGDNGTIMRTTDGSTWSTTPIGLSDHLFSVSFVNSLTGWVAGEKGLMMKTTDGGTTWVRQSISIQNAIQKIKFINENVGYALGDGRLFRTTNGGGSWVTLNVLNATSLDDFSFVDESVGWVVSESTIYKTLDGGSSWTSRRSNYRGKVYAYDRTNCWFVYYDGANTKIQRTTDGGTTWSDHFITDNYLSQFMVEQVFFQDSQKGYIIGNYINKSSPNISLSSGAVWMTTNGGQSWTKPYTNEFSALPKALAFKNATNGLVVGRGGLMVDLHSSGSASDKYRNRTYQNLNSIAFSTNANGEAVGGRLLLMPNSSSSILHDDSKSVSIKSTSGGAEWTKVENTRGSTLFQIRYKNGGEIGWKVGFHTLNVTKDGGSTWKNIYDDFGLPFNEGYTVAKAYLPTESSGFFLTADPYGTGSTSLFRFSGNTLSRIDLPYKDSGDPYNTSLHDLFFVNDQVGFITTSNGKLIKTTDGGANWSVQVVKAGSVLYKCFFVNEQVGWVIGREGLILKTTDGGQTWINQPSGTNVSLNGLHFVSEQIGYTAGADGVVLKTTNGGATWIRQSTGTRNTLNDINFTDPEHGWIVGNDGTILKLVISECRSLSDPVTIQMSTSPEATITASGTTAFCEGGNVDLTAGTGEGYKYQWFRDGNALPNAVSSQLRATLSGEYKVQVTNAGGCKQTSESTRVVVNPLPAFTLVAPVERTICSGKLLEFKVQSTTPANRYEWFRNGQPVANAAAANLVISESGTYEVKVTSDAGCTRTSDRVVINPPYQISLVAEGNTTFCEGENVKLSVQSSSSTLSSYQWYRNGTAIPGANLSSYIAVASGDYTVETVDTARCNVISEPKQVVSRPLPAKPAITTGSDLKLVSSAATGNQWYLNGTTITGATSAEYSPVQSGRYTVQVTQEGCSSAMSEAYEYVITASRPLLRASVVLYPNPVSEQLFVSIQDVAGTVLVELINSAGQKVAQKHTYVASQHTAVLPFDVRGLAAGTYVVRVQSLTFTKTTQVILIR